MGFSGTTSMTKSSKTINTSKQHDRTYQNKKVELKKLKIGHYEQKIPKLYRKNPQNKLEAINQPKTLKEGNAKLEATKKYQKKTTLSRNGCKKLPI